MGKNSIDKARDTANEISKGSKRNSRRGKNIIKKDVDNYLEKLSHHIKKIESRFITSDDKIPASTWGRFGLSKNPSTAKHGTKL